MRCRSPVFAAVCGPVGFDFNRVGFACGVVIEAAPAIVFRLGDQASGDWVAVDVLDLLYKFGCREDVEVVVPGLPEMGALALEQF